MANYRDITIRVRTDSKQAEAAMDRLEGKVLRTKTSAGGLSKGFGALQKQIIAAFSVAVVTRFVQELIQVSRQLDSLQRKLDTAFGRGQGAVAFGRATDLAQEYGLSLVGVADGYAKLTAAAQGTALEGKQTEQIFEAIIKASSSLRLSAADTGGVLTAIEQIISKGTVSSEELRGQLGERLPGAFQLAAKAAGVTTEELGKMLQRGEVLATEFLPQFAATLAGTFEVSAREAAEGLDASMNRLETSWTLLQKALFEDLAGSWFAAGVEGGSSFLDGLRQTIEDEGLSKALGEAIGRVAVEGMKLAGAALVEAPFFLETARRAFIAGLYEAARDAIQGAPEAPAPEAPSTIGMSSVTRAGFPDPAEVEAAQKAALARAQYLDNILEQQMLRELRENSRRRYEESLKEPPAPIAITGTFLSEGHFDEILAGYLEDEDFSGSLGEFANTLRTDLRQALLSGNWDSVGQALLQAIRTSVIDTLLGRAFDALGQTDFGRGLGFHSGGIVPGAMGADVPIVAQAGELILNKAQQRNLASGLGGTTIIDNTTVYGNADQQTQQFIARRTRSLARQFAIAGSNARIGS